MVNRFTKKSSKSKKNIETFNSKFQ